MEKHSLILWAAIFLCSCSKTHSDPKPIVTQTWISGKWKRTFYGDTTFYRDGSKIFTPQTQTCELNFIDTNKVTRSTMGTQSWPYSLSTMTINFDGGNGAIFKITKLSDTKIKLDWHYYTTGIDILAIDWVDVYVKE
jgi:hypothetical protein